jgi:hypothetical protein
MMKRILLSLSVVLVFAAAFVWAQPVSAQAKGTVSGNITGPNGALAGLKVNILDSNGAVVGTTTTSATGAYSVAGLPLGSYTVQVVGKNGGVAATGTGIATASLTMATVNIALTSSQLAAAGIAGGGGFTFLGMTGTTLLIGGGVVAGGAVLIHQAGKPSSPNR